MNWLPHRREDGSINLVNAYTEYVGRQPNLIEIQYLAKIEKVQSITSRQVAAMILVNAEFLM